MATGDSGPPTRRRSNSSTGNSSIAASRPKRRSRGLPSSSSRTSTPRGAKSNNNATIETPEEYKKGKLAAAEASSKRSSTRRTTRGASPPPPAKMQSSSSSDLVAISPDKKSVNVQLLLNGELFYDAASANSSSPEMQPETTPSSSSNNSKHEEKQVPPTTKPPSAASSSGSDDHNLFHCHVCHKLGSVVCCDNCPHVYHKNCIPETDPSRKSLENDEDPWYCPACHPDATKQEIACLVCLKVVNVSKEVLHTCTGCGGWVHDSCIQKQPSDTAHTPIPPLVCDKCQEAKMLVNKQVLEKMAMAAEEPPVKRRKLSDIPNENMEEEETGNVDDENIKSSPVTEESSSPIVTRRTRSASASEVPENEDEEEDDEEEENDEEDGSTEEMEEDDDEEEKEPNGEDEEDDEEMKDESPNNSSSSSSSSPKAAPEQKTAPRKRSRASLPSSSRNPSSRITSAKQKKEKEKQKRKERNKKNTKHGKGGKEGKDSKSPRGSPSSTSTKSPSNDQDAASAAAASPTQPRMAYGANAIPAFYFYLAENRPKIERSLSRRHRYFNRLPKGMERNELVAKEGAGWWVKLRQSDVQRYMDISMKDFEQRIIEWKEEKNIQDMVNENGVEEVSGTDPLELTPEDEKLTYDRHRRLYLGTTVGSKPFKPESGVSHNRILLELLQDMRFHPAPMLMANRTDKEYGQMDFTRITIPYFDAHGPVSTSMGDECLGCTRGWTHYCNVLKRRVPAIEHRAKLQPPLSSLMATRVGLGLLPKAPNATAANEDDLETVKNLAMYSTREDPDTLKAKSLPVYHWEGLASPADRADDIVQFIEETVAMKVPEPPRPLNPSKLEASKKSGFGRVALPLRGRKKSFDGDGDIESVNKCGRCRTVIQTDTGCIQCRRAQLVINMSRQSNSEDPDGNEDEGDMPNFLKVSTYMLGRVTMKEGSGEIQSEGDQAVSNGILRQRWTPFAVLPSHTLNSPTPKAVRPSSRKNDDDDSMSDSDSSSDESKDEEIQVLIEEAQKDVEMTVAPDDKSEDSNGEDSPTGKRHRSARIGAQVTSLETQDDAVDRQKMAQKFKEEASDLNKKCIQKACCGILLGLMRRDPLLLFARPVRAEGYSVIIKNPIDFEKIRGNVLGGKYATLGSFVSDARLLCTNALTYNPPGSIYWKTAKELYDVLAVMQKRASDWIGSVKDCHAHAWRTGTKVQTGIDEDDVFIENAFEDLQNQWPEAVKMLEDSEWLQKDLCADFMRTKENETAYYGGLAVRRAAVAAEASLTPYPDQAGVFNIIGRRTHAEDKNLRNVINERVTDTVEPMHLKDLPTWREESIIRVMRRSQSRRLDGLIGSINGCARCDGMRVDQDLKMAMTAETLRWGRSRKKNSEAPRVATSRIDLSSGLGSQRAQDNIKEQVEEMAEAKEIARKSVCAQKAAVTVRGSRVHGWGLYADQPFNAGDIVAEYIGEYVSLAVTEAREKMYQTKRIQDYQFRLDERLVIDATMRGGHGRYINHNCSPNCVAKMIAGDDPNQHLKRVLIVAQRNIKPREELTYDYQFPLELNLDARIPCNCHSEHCRGFMNWDLPEKGSNSRVFRSQKRGANMRDRIRRLGRPLKGDK